MVVRKTIDYAATYKIAYYEPQVHSSWEWMLRYIQINDHEVLPDAGRITHEQAEEKALSEYEKYRVIQDREILSDFDQQLKLLFGE